MAVYYKGRSCLVLLGAPFVLGSPPQVLERGHLAAALDRAARGTSPRDLAECKLLQAQHRACERSSTAPHRQSVQLSVFLTKSTSKPARAAGTTIFELWSGEEEGGVVSGGGEESLRLSIQAGALLGPVVWRPRTGRAESRGALEGAKTSDFGAFTSAAP